MPVSSGDTAWILISSALVLLMTPGLALFYGGMARRKNLLSTIMMSFAIMGLVGIIWVLWGYSLSFGSDSGGFIGGFIGGALLLPVLGLTDTCYVVIILKIATFAPLIISSKLLQ